MVNSVKKSKEGLNCHGDFRPFRARQRPERVNRSSRCQGSEIEPVFVHKKSKIVTQILNAIKCIHYSIGLCHELIISRITILIFVRSINEIICPFILLASEILLLFVQSLSGTLTYIFSFIQKTSFLQLLYRTMHDLIKKRFEK